MHTSLREFGEMVLAMPAWAFILIVMIFWIVGPMKWGGKK